MSEEIQQTQEQEQQEINVAQEEAAMEASFAEARGEDPTAGVEAEQSPETGEQQPEAQEAKQEVLIAGLTEDQLKAALLKAGQVDELNTQLRKAFGRMGELQGHIQQLRQGSAGGVKLSADKLKRLSSEFPEMAQMIAEDLSEALQGTGGAAFDHSQLDHFVSERLSATETKIQQEMEKRWLTRQHRDWQTVVKSDDFELWVQNVLPKEEAAALGDSWDAEFISDKLSEFKSWRDRSTQPDRSKENKQKRLEAAIAPSGNRGEPNNTMSEEDAMEKAFNRARGRV